jgi:ribonuclease T2
MKQFGLGVIVGAGILALGAYFVAAKPQMPAIMGSTQRADSLPQGTGFDFYVLSLSWSPSYCQSDQARKRDVTQCAGPRPYAFVVHGLWPQFERGYPRACHTEQNRPRQDQVRAMLDIMPSERLVQHQWNQHGSCSGLSARDYLTVTRAARQRIRVPEVYMSTSDWRRVSVRDVEAAFIESNPGMTAAGIAIARRGNLLSEVRICLTRDLSPRQCPEVDSDGVPIDTRLSMPPTRG